MSERPPFRADHVGSFLRPKTVVDARAQRAEGEIGPEELREVGRSQSPRWYVSRRTWG